MMFKTVMVLTMVLSAPPAHTAPQTSYARYLKQGRALYYSAVRSKGKRANRLLKRAIRMLDKALALEQRPGAQFFKALCLVELGQYGEAKALLELVQNYKRIPDQAKREIPELLQRIARLMRLKIVIETTPAGAEVVVGGNRVGLSPVTIERAAGHYNIVIRKTGYRDVTEHIHLRSKPIHKKLTLERKPASIALETPAVKEATVHINGDPAGWTPMRVELQPGTYRVEVLKRGYQNWSEQIELDMGQAVAREIKLIPLAPKATSGYRIGAYVALGVTVASVATAGALHGLALRDRDRSNEWNQEWVNSQSSYSSGQDKMTAAQAMYGIGGVAAAATIVLFVIDLTRDRGADPPKTALMLSPVDRGAALGAAVRF